MNGDLFDTVVVFERDPAMHAESLRALTQSAFPHDPVTIVEELTDSALDLLINAAHAAVCAAPNYEAARPHGREMARLIAQRTKWRVAALERERGLR